MTATGETVTHSPRDAAMQAEMLEIDQTYGAEWLNTMADLVAKQLPHVEFTEQRMAALKFWTKRRKRAQSQLRWKYDTTGRRKQDLVDRDIKRGLARARRILDEYRSRPIPELSPLAAIRKANTDATRNRTNIRDMEVDLAASMLGEPTPVPTPPPAPVLRSLEGVQESRIAMVSTDTGYPDLTTVSDDDIINAYLTLGVPRDVAEQYLAMLEPTQ